MTAKDIIHKKLPNKREKVGHELVPPEGGWGLVVALAVTITFSAVIVPTGVFGIVFGPFLASIGDEASATAIVNSIFNTVLCFTGLAANHLLQKTSYRKVGILGAVLYFLGSFATIFVTTTIQMIISWGVVQGLGFGLMMPAVFTAFNQYFNDRKNFAMSASQALVAVVNIIFPILTKMSMAKFGFRGTVALLSAFGLNCIPAMLSLQPVKWHMVKKRSLAVVEINGDQNQSKMEDEHTVVVEDTTLLDEKILVNREVLRMRALEGSRRSLVSIGNISLSVLNVNKDETSGRFVNIWQSLSKSLDLALFKDSSFVNIAFGLALSMTSDLAFLSIFPLLLTNAGLNVEELTLVMTVYFSADLICRVLVSLLTALVNIKSRHLLLFGALFSAIFRIMFVMDNSFWWILSVSTALGFLRSLIQIPIPLVVAEAYPVRFVTAFSLYMVVSGVVALSFGPLMSFIKHITGRLDMVVHLLTLAYLFCAIPWIIELLYVKYLKK